MTFVSFALELGRLMMPQLAVLCAMGVVRFRRGQAQCAETAGACGSVAIPTH